MWEQRGWFMLAKPPLWEKPFGFAKYNPVEPLGLSDAVFDAGYITSLLIRDVPPWLSLNERAKAVNVIFFSHVFFSLRKSFSTSDCVKENINTKPTPHSRMACRRCYLWVPFPSSSVVTSLISVLRIPEVGVVISLLLGRFLSMNHF